MSEKIEPALTPAEWANPMISMYGTERSHPSDAYYVIEAAAARRNLAKVIATANYFLPDSDPRKITRETVGNIRDAVGYMDSHDGSVGNPRRAAKELNQIADALESYLPPEGTA